MLFAGCTSDPASSPSATPSETPVTTPSENPSENPSEEPSESPSENPDESTNPSEEPSETPDASSIDLETSDLADIMAVINTGVESDGFFINEITEDTFNYELGIDYIEGAEAIYSGPMITSIAYCSYLVRLPEGTDAAAVAEEIEANANPNKWVCVTAEKVAVRQSGNLIFFTMANTADVDTMVANFEALTSANNG